MVQMKKGSLLRRSGVSFRSEAEEKRAITAATQGPLFHKHPRPDNESSHARSRTGGKRDQVTDGSKTGETQRAEKTIVDRYKGA